MSSSLVVACPGCGQKNRVPADRLTAGGRCGTCKSPLFTSHPVSLDAAGLEAQLGADIPVVVDFWASWCGPCRQFAPVFEQAAHQLEPQVRLAKIDTEALPQVAQRYGIRSIPTLIMFRQGREVARISGALPLPGFLQWVQQSLAGRNTA